MPAATVVIVNPQARGGWPRRRWPLIEPELRAALGPLELQFTRRQGDGTTLARRAALAGARLVVAMGGDGTASEVAAGLLQHQEQQTGGEPACSFGYLPCSTGGDFRRSLQIPEELGAAARNIAAAPGRLLDAGQLDYTGHDGRPQKRFFLNIASAGMSGLVDLFANQSSKRLGGFTTFVVASARAALRYRNPRVRVRLDDGACEELRLYTLAVANGGYFGGGMHIAPDACLDDGVFDVITLGDLSPPEAVVLLPHLYKGSHLTLRKVTAAKARSVQVMPCEPGDRVLLDVDGETPGRLPARFTLLPRALHFRG